MQEIQQKEHQQSMFFYDKAEMQKAIANINAKVEPILRLLKSVSSRAGIHSFDRVLTPLLKQRCLNLTTATGGPSPVNLTIFGTITEEQKQEALKEALFKFDSINFSIIPERIQETIKRANASGIISVTEDSDIVVRAEIAHNGEFVYDITITAKNTGRAVMTLNKDGSIAGYETKEPFDPKKKPKKHSNLLNNREKTLKVSVKKQLKR